MVERYDPSSWDLTDEELERHKAERISTGMSFYDWINADQFIAQIIIDTCQRHLDQGTGHPASIGLEEWKDILTEMRDGFLQYLEREQDFGINGPTDKYDRAMQLFVKWHRALWD